MTTREKIAKQQEGASGMVRNCGDHLLEFLDAHPQYEDLIGEDLENPDMSLAKFEKKISDAARKNGGGLGGKAADDVLRKFYGLPEKDGAAKPADPAPADGGFDFSVDLFGGAG